MKPDVLPHGFHLFHELLAPAEFEAVMARADAALASMTRFLATNAPTVADPWDREYASAADWPDETDADRWAPTEPDAFTFSPDPEEAAWWAVIAPDLGDNDGDDDTLVNALPRYPAVFPDDLRWLERHEAEQASRITDMDHAVAAGCV